GMAAGEEGAPGGPAGPGGPGGRGGRGALRGQGGQRNRDPGDLPPGPFSSMLSGQRENAQEQQGPDGHEYGGVYKSTDCGKTWERINSVNPRPMYFSRIRVDPSDNNYLYVLGVSIYRSKDGGKTFTGDGSR